MSNHVHNGRVQLVASAANNIAVVIIVVGIACLVLGERPRLWRGLVALAATGIGVALHWGARAWLGRLKP